MERSVRTRIAPSPTGNLHVGTARAALFNYLFAKANKGTFVVRIEDTDTARSTKEFEKNILNGLSWLGINWDEGPSVDGPDKGDYGPYRQSERSSYTKFLEQLVSEGKAGYCDVKDKENTFEAHWCEKHGGFNNDKKGIIRFKNDAYSEFKNPTITSKGTLDESGSKIQFDDLIRGVIPTYKILLGDFSIAKSIGEPLYNFAVVVDDHEMQITHVIRGEDHIPNTPKQILILEALGFKRPIYAHLPLLLGQDRSKLSKRHGATSVDEYRQQGYLPEALFNFLALLGWNPGDEREKMSEAEIIKEFSLERVQKSGAIFDTVKLDWLNGEYIREKSAKELAELCKPFLKDILPTDINESYLEKVISLEQPRLKKLSEMGEGADYFFREPEYPKELLIWKKSDAKGAKMALKQALELISTHSAPFDRTTLEKLFFDAIGGGDKGALLWPLRVALSGKKFSPSPFEILEVLDKERSLVRIKAALAKLGA